MLSENNIRDIRAFVHQYTTHADWVSLLRLINRLDVISLLNIKTTPRTIRLGQYVYNFVFEACLPQNQTVGLSPLFYSDGVSDVEPVLDKLVEIAWDRLREVTHAETNQEAGGVVEEWEIQLFVESEGSNERANTQ